MLQHYHTNHIWCIITIPITSHHITSHHQEIKISEGMEVEFFGIVENSKGKMSDRAVHLQVLPTGTVIFEYAIAEQVEAGDLTPLWSVLLY